MSNEEKLLSKEEKKMEKDRIKAEKRVNADLKKKERQKAKEAMNAKEEQQREEKLKEKKAEEAEKLKKKRLSEGDLSLFEQFDDASFVELEALLLKAETREERAFYRSLLNLKLQIEQEKVIGEVLL